MVDTQVTWTDKKKKEKRVHYKPMWFSLTYFLTVGQWDHSGKMMNPSHNRKGVRGKGGYYLATTLPVLEGQIAHVDV